MTDPASHTSPPSVIQRLDELFKPWNGSAAPGLIVGVAHHGRLLYRRGFGLASIEHAVVNTPSTRMRIGSTSKQFAALAVMLLAEQGRLDPEAPIRLYLPELKNAAGEPTLRQLMLHTGGVRDPMVVELLRHQGILPVLPAGHNLSMSLRFRDGNFPPGERMNYSNNGYHLLSLAIERVCGKSLGEVLAEYILRPLGMHDTALLPSDMHIVPGLATFHVPLPGGGYRRGIYPTEELLGAGGMISTIDDMLTWMAHLRSPEKKVGTSATWTRMLQRPRYSSGAEGSYCLGLLRTPYRGMETVQHSGATLGAACQMLTVPDKALDIIVMSNRIDVPTAPMANKIIDIVLAGEGLEPPKRPVPAQEYEALLGRWYSPRSHTLLEFVRHRLEPESQDVLAVKTHNELSGFLFDVDGVLRKAGYSVETLDVPKASGSQGAANDLQCALDGNTESFVRMTGAPPSAEQIASYAAGRYRLADFGIEMELSLQQGRLRLDVLSPYAGNHLLLEPFSAEILGSHSTQSAVALPLPHASVVLERASDGSVTGLWLNGNRERNIWFERHDAGGSKPA